MLETDKVTNAVEQNKNNWASFQIYQKHLILLNILLYKLEHYGFRGIVFHCLKNYLSNRKQYISFNSSESEQKEIVCGVPQGSILGPLLFILHVNDTSDVLA